MDHRRVEKGTHGMTKSLDSSRLARTNRPAFRGLLKQASRAVLRRRLRNGKDRLVKNLIYEELRVRRQGAATA